MVFAINLFTNILYQSKQSNVNLNIQWGRECRMSVREEFCLSACGGSVCSGNIVSILARPGLYIKQLIHYSNLE